MSSRMRISRSRQAIAGLQALLILCGFAGFAARADAAGSSVAALRITDAVDDSKLVAAGAAPRFATTQNDKGAVSDGLPLEHIFLQLHRSPDQEAALDSLIEAQQNPHSSSYHQWLSAAELGERFGPARADIATVTQWLSSHGLAVNQVHESGMTVDFSGTAGQVRDAFHTEIHQYSVNGTERMANASAPMIPAALASVVSGVSSLSDLKPKSLLLKPKMQFTFKCVGCPDGFDNTVQYDEAPADFAVIYNVAPLYTAKHPITGKGQTVVVLEDTDIQSADVATFRKAAGLSSYGGTFAQIHPGSGCADPGTNGAEGEAAIDAEWAGAIAPDAAVKLASCADTAVQFGAFIAALNLLDEKSPPPIMSLSYGECEAQVGPTGPFSNPFIYSMWQQAAAEGVSVFVSAGDGAAAVCDDFDTATYAAQGIAANGLGSTPYNTATGGTDFLDTALNENSKYWSSSNKSFGESALSYIPEMPWDDSCAGSILYGYYGFTSGVTFCNGEGSVFLNIVGGSGAPSAIYPKPYWQHGVTNIPADGARDLPDVSLFASNGFWNHAIVFCMSDATEGGAPCDYSNPLDTFYNSAGGTSFTAPQYASIQALINQKAGGRQGNAAPIYYDLARGQVGSASCNASNGNKVGSSCIFHDVTVGNNNVPCYGPVNCYNPTGGAGYGVLSTSDTKLKVAYPAQTGWDFATGLGSVNVTNLVNAWP